MRQTMGSQMKAEQGPKRPLHALAFSLAVWLVWSGVLLTALGTQSAMALPRPDVRLEAVQDGDAVVAHRVLVNGQWVTTVHHGDDVGKPYLYPLQAVGIDDQGQAVAVPLTRSFPMGRQPGESRDHPHHRSVWLAHGEVNGLDFWHEPASGVGTKLGHIALSFVEASQQNGWPVLTLVGQGQDAEGHAVFEQTLVLQFGADWASPAGDSDLQRSQAVETWVDVRVTWQPIGDQKLVFGETKEGTFGVRVHPALRMAGQKFGDQPTTGQWLSSEGLKQAKAWGKPADWLFVSGQVEGQAVFLQVLADNDVSPLPTRWHAREYGLLAANPFGGHVFDGNLPKGAGRFVAGQGESVTLRHRLVWGLALEGQASPANRANLWQTGPVSDSE